MIVEGIKLAIIGILIVYLFLFLLVVVVHLSSWLLKPYTDREARELAILKRKSSANALLKDSRMIAVITAAVSAHRKKAMR
jgi:sodium pump decarboxylase gamma subunit